jgi:hypothetical protein
MKLKVLPDPKLLPYANRHLASAMNTDALFLFPPAQLALASLAKAVEETQMGAMWDK